MNTPTLCDICEEGHAVEVDRLDNLLCPICADIPDNPHGRATDYSGT